MGTGVVYHGMELVGGGAVLAGLILGAIAAFIIDRQFRWAGLFAAAGAVLAFGVQLAIAASPAVALGYALMAGICFFFAWQEEAATGAGGWHPPVDDEEPDQTAQP